MTHMKRHGGQAAQAKRRDEEWIACTDCTTHDRRRLRQAEPEPREESFLAQLAVAFLLFAALYLLALVGAAVGKVAA